MSATSWAIEPGTQTVKEEFPFSPTNCAFLLCAITLLISLADHKRKKITWAWDLTLMLADGVAGLILLAMVFSQHPTVNLNLQILLLNPLNLVFLYPTVRDIRKHKANRWLTIWLIFICLFFIGTAIQHYAEGMLIVASTLLIRILFIKKIVNSRQ